MKFEELPTTAIRPNSRQPRRSFPEAGIKELAASIREVGILQPLVVRSTPDGFELIAGERRLRAAREAGLDRVPVLIRQAGENESMELALVENLQREDLNPLETAAAYQALMEGFGLSKEQLANRLGKSRAAVTNTLRLGQLPEKIRALLEEGSSQKDTPGRCWVSRPRSRWSSWRRGSRSSASPSGRPKSWFANTSPEPGKRAPTQPQQRSETPVEFDEASRRMREALELPVRVKPLRRGGKVEIRFREKEELDALLTLLSPERP